MTIIILGRQPALGFAECESLFGADKVQKLADNIAGIDLPVEIVNRQELGGAIKVARRLSELPTTDWSELLSHCHNHLPQHISRLMEGKIKLGLSVYGLGVSTQSINKAALTLKQAIRNTGRSVRIIPNTAPQLNSAQVLHNKLTAELGIELLFIKSGNNTWLAQTVRVQNIENYTKRDRGRPMRDAFVGMLPPKLAQIMVNLACGKMADSRWNMADGKDTKPKQLTSTYQQSPTILDPFCGTGVVLQEAALYGFVVYGTDLSDKMVRFTRDNLNWLQDTYGMSIDWQVEVADATDTTWQQPIDHIVCEAYLGQPLSSIPDEKKLNSIIQECNTIALGFLKNLAPQVKPGSRHCIALPAWRLNDSFRHLPVIDDLEVLGYNRIDFKNATKPELIYHRPDQIVARELLVITRK